MIKKISIQNFKSFENETINCSNLNILTGLNGMGKSTVIQSLLLLRQSYDKGSLQNDGLSLNGELTSLGVAQEVLFNFANKDIISLTLQFDNEEVLFWNYPYKADSDFSKSDLLPYDEDFDIPANLDQFQLFKYDSFKYLNAERVVKNEYETSYTQVVKKRNVGVHGEYAAHFLEQYGQLPINEALICEGTDVNTLSHQLSAWMNEVSPGVKVLANRIIGTNSVRLRYAFEGEFETTEEIAPINVGLGITYILPVLLLVLTAKKGDIIIIENPESHIHPKGQSTIGRLLAIAAQTGVQIFVETHSDHIINGVLIASKRFESDKKGINKDLVRIVQAKKELFRTKIVEIHVLAGGKIDKQPDDFFDQSEKDLKQLLGF